MTILNHSIPQNEVQPVYVDFGKINEENDCEGFGVCRISMRTETSKHTTCRCKHAIGFLFCSAQNEMTLRFNQSDLSTSVFAKYFSTGQFLMPENVFVGEELSTRFSYDRIVFERGIYAISENASFFDVKIKSNMEKPEVTALVFGEKIKN